jgi:hypothetical protein
MQAIGAVAPCSDDRVRPLAARIDPLDHRIAACRGVSGMEAGQVDPEPSATGDIQQLMRRSVFLNTIHVALDFRDQPIPVRRMVNESPDRKSVV